jgi:hypothetical protein
VLMTDLAAQYPASPCPGSNGVVRQGFDIPPTSIGGGARKGPGVHDE